MTEKKSSPRSAIRWSHIPHSKLVLNARASIPYGSVDRARDDASRHVLQVRLCNMKPEEHAQYVELECARIVELLRSIRDHYRAYLEEKGCQPIGEMYGVVFRYAIVQNAFTILREAMLNYIVLSRINHESWDALFGTLTPDVFPHDRLTATPNEWQIRAKAAIRNLTHVEGIYSGSGGPFSREAQATLGALRPWPSVFLREMSFGEHIEARRRLWDRCEPWTDSLARLFDATQGELVLQSQMLPIDSQRAEPRFAEISEFQEIAYRHLRLRRGAHSRNVGAADWIALLRDLDQAKIPLAELRGKAHEIRVTLARKGLAIHSWEHCYNATRVTLEDGKPYTLKQATTHFIHNTASAAEKQLGKVYSVRAIASIGGGVDERLIKKTQQKRSR